MSERLLAPFAGLRAAAEHARAVAAPPYDVMSAAEARAAVEGRPWSFLHVSRPEVDLAPETPAGAPALYEGAAAAFARRAIVIDHPGVQTRRFSEFCTAVTVEVGTARDPSSIERAGAYMKAAFRWREPPRASARQLCLYRNLARVLIDGEDGAVIPRQEFEAFNFERAECGTVIANVRDGQGMKAVDESGADVTARFFKTVDGEIRLRRPVIPSMYTADLRAARADCLCYLLEPLP